MSVSPDQVVKCRDFTAKNCLAYALCALSSHDVSVRSLAYGVLARSVYTSHPVYLFSCSFCVYVLRIIAVSVIGIRQIFTRLANVQVHAYERSCY